MRHVDFRKTPKSEGMKAHLTKDELRWFWPDSNCCGYKQNARYQVSPGVRFTNTVAP
jgi:hypothetical protein